MSENYEGPERRKNAIESEHRFTMLEGIAESNKRGIEAVHARLTNLTHDIHAEIRIGNEDIKDILRTQAIACVACKANTEARLTLLERLVERIKAFYKGAAWVTATSGGVGGLLYKILHHTADKVK